MTAADTTPETWLVRAELFAKRSVLPVAGEAAALAASTCTECRRVHFPARDQCPACGADAQHSALSTRALLGPCTAVLHPPPGALVEVPYLVGVARFPEGISILGVVTGAAQTPPQGTPVDTVAMALPDGRLTYAFRPAAPPHQKDTART